MKKTIIILTFLFANLLINASIKQDTIEVRKLYLNASKTNNNKQAIVNYFNFIKKASKFYFIDNSFESELIKSYTNVQQLYDSLNKTSSFQKLINKIVYIYVDYPIIYIHLLNLLPEETLFKKKLQDINEKIKYLFNQKKYNTLGRLFLKFGNYFYGKNNFLKSLTFYHLSYDFFKLGNDEVGISKSFNNLSIINLELGHLNQSEKYLKESIKIKLANNDSFGLASTFNNLAQVYFESSLNKKEENNLDSALYYKNLAIFYFEKSIVIDSISENIDGIATSFLNLGNIYNDFKEYNKALKYYNKAEKLFSKINDDEGKLYYYINLTDLLLKMSEDCSLSKNQKEKYINQAKSSILKAFKFLNNSNIQYNYNIFNYCSTIYGEQKKYDSAYYYFKKAKLLKDSLDEINRKNYLIKLEQKFYTKQKESEINYLNKQQKLTQFQRNIILFSAITITLLLSVLLYQIYKRLNITRKQNHIISIQKSRIQKIYEQLNQKNKLLNDSIQYASSIQKSFLSDEQELQNLFREAFILFLPKDILSGDFYFLSKNKEYIYLAVGDCAGHGIPGAIMSMITYTILQQIIKYDKEQQTALILKKLHNELFNIQTQFNANDLTESVEISLIIFDTIHQKITLSSTNQDVYIIHKNEINIIEGDIFSIGQCFSNEESVFKQTTINYLPQNKIILSTDGYYDEINEINKKKFSKQSFVKLLDEHKNVDLIKLKQVLQEKHTEWNNKKYQTDDICVIGIEV